ncbi:hypothetical protein B0H12DRAFT_1246620 [Mycena haematopus]|nr:hypothetical protein B0H12DRAFT_1246620 [Mycena haematopus]
MELAQHRARIMEDEARRRDLNKAVTAAQLAAAADPGDKAKVSKYTHLRDEYETAFGHYIEDSKAHAYVIKKRQREATLDGLWDVADTQGCPIENPGPLEAYLKAAYDFLVDFRQPYRRDDGRTAELNGCCRILERYNKLQENCAGREGELERLVGQESFEVRFANPYPSYDPRRQELDAEMRALVATYAGKYMCDVAETLRPTELTFRIANRYSQYPDSAKCRRHYCKTRLLAEDLKSLQQDAEKNLALVRPTLAPALSTSQFYNVLHSLRGD